jgi:hypothetical protein
MSGSWNLRWLYISVKFKRRRRNHTLQWTRHFLKEGTRHGNILLVDFKEDWADFRNVRMAPTDQKCCYKCLVANHHTKLRRILACPRTEHLPWRKLTIDWWRFWKHVHTCKHCILISTSNRKQETPNICLRTVCKHGRYLGRNLFAHYLPTMFVGVFLSVNIRFHKRRGISLSPDWLSASLNRVI